MDTVLVVGHLQVLDDELAKSLQDSGLAVVEARDAEEGMHICRSARPALAFVEVDSPDGDHFALLPKLRRAMERDGRIVAVCNRYSDALDDYCEKLGANFALPQVEDRANFALFVRGLITLIPQSPAARSAPSHSRQRQ